MITNPKDFYEQFQNFIEEVAKQVLRLNEKPGVQGEKGEKGDPFTFEDFTPEQLESLRGPQGLPGRDGLDGNDGKTPVLGTDYFTEADKQEIVNSVLASLVDGDKEAY